MKKSAADAIKQQRLKNGKSLSALDKRPSDIRLVGGKDEKLFDLLIERYKPWMLKDFKNGAQYLITVKVGSERKNIGVVSIWKSDFVQLAIAPQFTGHGFGLAAMKQLGKLSGVERIRWSSDRSNKPSLKLLRDLGGGVYESGADDTKQKSVEGHYFTDGKRVPSSMTEALDRVIAERPVTRITERPQVDAKISEYLK